MRRVWFIVLMSLCFTSVGQAEVLKTEKFHGGDLVVQVIRFTALVIENLGDSASVFNEYRLKFSVAEGKCFRIYFLSGDFVKSVAVSSSIADGEDGAKLEISFLPQLGEDLVILVQNPQCKWKMKVIPYEVFTEEKEAASLADTMYPKEILKLLGDGE